MDSIAILGFLAALTSRLKLATGVLLLPLSCSRGARHIKGPDRTV